MVGPAIRPFALLVCVVAASVATRATATATAAQDAGVSDAPAAALQAPLMATPTTATAASWQALSGADGMRGLWELHGARSGRNRELVLAVTPYYSRSTSLLVDGDLNILQHQTLALSYTFDRHWALGGSVSQTINHNTAYDIEPAQVLGDPVVALHYTAFAQPRLAAAARLRLAVPTAAATQSLAFGAMSGNLGALLSWMPRRALEATLNVGYTLDFRRNLFGAADRLNHAQRFAAGVPARSRLEGGLGASYMVAAGAVAELAPFAEVYANIVP
ncbi:MAG: hypothetical protein EOO40_03335, partial [Deltaproteobacteria bacterium]